MGKNSVKNKLFWNNFCWSIFGTKKRRIFSFKIVLFFQNDDFGPEGQQKAKKKVEKGIEKMRIWKWGKCPVGRRGNEIGTKENDISKEDGMEFG